MKRSYWLDLFTPATWQEFRDSGAKVSGFRETRWSVVQKIKIGDYLLCYMTGISRFIAVLEVTKGPYIDETPLWKDESFPCRLGVKVVAELNFETAVPVRELDDRLSCFQDLKTPHAWTGSFRSSPARWKDADGEAVVEAILEAVKNPVIRPVDPGKMAYRPKAIKAKIGPVTVPDLDQDYAKSIEDEKKPSEHTEIQWLLLKLGSNMGFDVWAAKNDKGKAWNGNPFSKIQGFKTELPLQFDEATNKTVELIDVLWLKKSTIVAAFEIESTTSIYSGLLRMSDLVSMQPNISIPLYLVAPDERRSKVMMEVNRPTFTRLPQPLSEICRFISFSTLRSEIGKVRHILKFLKPEFLDELSESCVLEEA